MREYKTTIKVEKELTRTGTAHRQVRETGTFANISGERGSERVLVLCTDMDALSVEDLLDKSYHSANFGYAHACDHDAHITALLHAVKPLQGRRHEFTGEIRFFFQPGEEVGQEAHTFIREGCLDGADRIFGVHMCSSSNVGATSLTPGPINASCDYFRIVMQGKGTHVSISQKGADALYIASQTVINLQPIVSRSLSPLDIMVVGIGTLHVGAQYNVVAEEALLGGTAHSFSSWTRAYINQRIYEIVHQTVSSYGGSTQVEFRDFATPLISDNQVVEGLTPVAQTAVSKDRVTHN